MTSSTCSSSRRPRLPPGCERAKSSSVKPRASSSATASASPIASAAVVLAVGARLSGQASAGTLTSRCTVASRASVEAAVAGQRDQRHAEALDHAAGWSAVPSVSPEFDSASTTSPRVIMPMSPWLASAGCRKNDGRAGAGERGGDLAADVAGLAHAGDDDAAAAGEQQAAGARRSPSPSRCASAATAVGLGGEDAPSAGDAGSVGHGACAVAIIAADGSYSVQPARLLPCTTRRAAAAYSQERPAMNARRGRPA